MKVVIYAMAERDAAALSVLIGKEFSGWTCEVQLAHTPWKLAAADAYVLDMTGMGAARCTEPLAAEVLNATGTTPALLVTMANDTGWSDCALFKTREAHVHVIRKPYGAEAMRAALRETFRKRQTPNPEAAVDASRVDTLRRRVTDKPPSLHNVTSLPAGDDISSLTVVEFQAWVAGFSADARHLFFRKLAPALAGGRPFEICLTLQHSVIVFPDENWVATNTPMAVILRLCKSDALASVATIRAVDADTVMKRVGGLGMNIEPLEPFLWNLHIEGEAPRSVQRYS